LVYLPFPGMRRMQRNGSLGDHRRTNKTENKLRSRKRERGGGFEGRKITTSIPNPNIESGKDVEKLHIIKIQESWGKGQSLKVRRTR